MTKEKAESGKNRGGRPLKLTLDKTTLKNLSGLGRLQCTTKEACAFFSVSEPTFLKFLNDHPDARAAFEDGKGQGLVSLRRTQFRIAETNAAMAIFLGKQYLAQRDQIGVGAPDGGPLRAITDQMTPQEAAEAYARTLHAEP